MSVVSDIIMAGLAASKPAASSSNDGYLYFETDTGLLVRSNAASWVQVGSSSGAGLFIKPDGSVAFTADQSMGGFKLTNVADPSSAQHAATKAYVDGVAANLGKRARVRAATTANITIATALNNADTLDGVTLATGDWVLVKNQSSAAENGVYEVGVSPARVSEFDTYNEHPGSLIAVQEGTVNADTAWLCTSNVGGTLNSTAIDFSALGTGSSAVEDLTTVETDTDLVLAPDGAGGVEWVTPASGSAWSQVVNESGASFANFTAVSGTWSSDGTVIKQTDASAAQRYARFTSKVSGAPLLFEAEIQLRSSGATRLGGIVGDFDGAGGAGGSGARIDEGGDSMQIEVVGTGTRKNITGLTINVNTWYKVRILISGNITTAWLDGVLMGTAGNMQNSNEASFIGLYTFQAEVWYRNIKAWNLIMPA